MEVHRETLYEEVWETPLSRLAPEKYGVSDVGLRKVCEKLHVPTPPRGYWAKRQHGKDPSKESLPDLPEDAPEAHTFDSTETSASEDSGSQEDDAEDFHVEGPPIEIPEITVDSHLKDPHPLVCNARSALKDARPDTYGRVQASTGKAVSVSVSPSETGRALRILDALVKGAESVGWPVRGASAGKHGASHFVIADEEVPFRITERTSREEKPESKRSSLDRKYRYAPTGQFRLEFPFDHPKPWGQKKWRDTETRDLEDVLPSILERAHEAAYGVKERREEQRQFQRKLQEKVEKRKERRRRREEEKRRREGLEEEAERWSKARSLREYIQEVRGRAEREELAPRNGRRSRSGWSGPKPTPIGSMDLPRFGGRFFTFVNQPRPTMPRTRPPYPQKFRDQIVELARNGRTPSDLADEFEPTAATIRNWLEQADRDEGKSADGLSTDEREELRELRKKLRQLKQERDILAKATAWFARETGDVPPKSSDS